MITWEPCQNSACVQTGTDEDGFVFVRNSRYPDPAVCFTRAEWDAYLDGIRKQERDRIRQLAIDHNVRVDMGPLSDAPFVPFADVLDGDGDA